MKKTKIIKIIITIIYLLLALILFINFLNSMQNSDKMSINFLCSILPLPFIVYLIISAYKSFKAIIQNNLKITIIDKIILAYSLLLLFTTLIFFICFYNIK